MKVLTKTYPSYLVHGLMLLMVTFVASSFPVGALITTAMPPEVMMCIRFFMAASLFAPYVFFKHGLHLPSINKLKNYTVLSIPLVVFFWCMFEGLRYTSALNTGAIYTVVPAITAVYVFLINREKTSKRRSFGLLIGTFGAVWIVFRGDLANLSTVQLNYGDALFFLGCLFLAAYNPLIKKFYSGEAMEVMTFWVIAIGCVWLLLLSIPSFKLVAWQGVSSGVYLGVLYLAIFTTVVTFFLLQFGTLSIGATRVAAYSFLTPVLVVVLNIFLGAEVFDFKLLPGIFLILIAMNLVQKER